MGRDARATPTRCSRAPGGAKVFVDPRSLKLLDGTVLDFDEDNLLATSFTLKNPHAKSTCGCGEIEFFRHEPPQPSKSNELANTEYKCGFVTDVEQDIAPRASTRTSSA